MRYTAVPNRTRGRHPLFAFFKAAAICTMTTIQSFRVGLANLFLGLFGCWVAAFGRHGLVFALSWIDVCTHDIHGMHRVRVGCRPGRRG